MTHLDPVTRLVLQTLSHLIEKERTMSAQVDALKAAVASLDAVQPVVISKIDELLQAVADLKAAGGVSPEELTDIQAQADAINAAVSALQAKVTAATTV